MVVVNNNVISVTAPAPVLGTPDPGDNGGGYDAPKLLRLAFHDCLLHEAGGGGCDGCLDWAGVGQTFDSKRRHRRHLDISIICLDMEYNYISHISRDRHYPDATATSNNGLRNVVEVIQRVQFITVTTQLATYDYNYGVEVLEAVYTDRTFPKKSPVLEMSLKESGKSRADLWSLAGLVAVEYGIETNNLKVDRKYLENNKNIWGC